MEITNTLENKSKFFGLYWGQKVMKAKSLSDRIVKEFTGKIYKDQYLQLTPLSQITDEDYLHLGFDCTDEKDVFEPITPYDFDYLRSKGYALPFMGLSVEQLVSFGWVKLKEE